METEELEVISDVSNGALEQMERASIDMQIATAKKWPRILSKVKTDMMSMATMDEDTAALCFYTIPRGGKNIQGPSIRLAEIAFACYGNLRAGSHGISTVSTGETPHVVVQGFSMDLEKNNAFSLEKRRRITKKKKNTAPDEDDITLATNACAAIAQRDAIFKVVPMILIKPVLEQCKKVAVGDIKSLVSKRAKVLDRLKLMGASEERILAAVEAPKVEDIDLGKLEILIGLGTALKDGATTLEEAFPHLMPRPKFDAPVPSLFTPTPTKTAEPADDIPMDYDQPAGVEPEPEPPMKIRTPWEQLEEILTAAGFTYPDLQIWAKQSGFYNNPDSYAQLTDVPKSPINKLINMKDALILQLTKLKEGTK